MHELLRRAGGFALSLLAERPGLARAALRARRAADRALARDREPRGARARRCSSARSAGSSAGWPTRSPTGDHTLFVGEVLSVELGRARPAARPHRVGVPVAVIEAVVFDLDGVLIQTEEIWDEVRERLVARPRRPLRRRRRSGR